jgi:hypothetical protein
MKSTILVTVLTAVLCPVASAQQPSQAAKAQTPRPTDSTILIDESTNLKSDLAQLRAMLNVLAAQESGVDTRTVAALQTNRQMWQIVIARLAELTQRIDALEQRQHPATTAPEKIP